MEVDLGSNIIRDTNGILVVEGNQQIKLEVGEDGQALLTMHLYDEQGEHIAKLNNNAWAFNNNDRFDITTNPDSLRLIDKEQNETVVEVNVISRTSIRVPQGRFFTHNGHEIDISPDALQLMGALLRGNVISAGNSAISIDGTGLGIG